MEGLFLSGEEVLPRSLPKMPADIEGIKGSAEVNMGVLDYVGEHICAGTSTMDINRWVEEYRRARTRCRPTSTSRATPTACAPPSTTWCCHGFDEGAVLSGRRYHQRDMSTIKGGFSDSSRMYCIGDVSDERRRLVEVCHESVKAGLAAVRPCGGHLGDVGAAAHKVAVDAGYSVVEEYGGHGIGKEFHEEPFVSFVSEGTGPILVPEPTIGWSTRARPTSPPTPTAGPCAPPTAATSQWEVSSGQRQLRAALSCLIGGGEDAGAVPVPLFPAAARRLAAASRVGLQGVGWS